MRAVTIAAAGAAVLGSVSASSHVKMMHARLHQRSDWTDSGDWSSSTADPVSPPETTDWPADPTTATSQDWPADPTTKSTDWPADPTTSSADWPADPTTTKAADWPADPTTTSSVVWEDWSSTSTKPVSPATASTASTWGPWSSSKAADPAKSSTWADWSSVEDPKKTSAAAAVVTTWADWSSTAADPATPTEAAASTWADWSSEGTSTTTISGTVTTTIYVQDVTAVASTVTSSVAPGWSSDGWFGSTWAVGPSACGVNVVSSYGAPTWHPTPDPMPVVTVTVTPTAAAAAESSSWADWSSTSVAEAATSSAWAASGDWASSSVAAGDWAASSAAPATPSSTGWASTGSAGFTPNGNTWGMTYSPYTNAGGCKDAATVSNDIWVIASKGFTTVRVYSTDCSTLEHVGQAARANKIKLILGVFISSTGIAGAQQQVTDIAKWAQWDIVELIVVGNEAVFNGYCSAPELAGFVSSSAWAFKAAGYTGKVTTTEPLSVWESSGTAFCGVVDVVAANLYAFFNAQTTADKAGALIQAQINILNGICPGKSAYVMESGWPSAGNCNGVACPSPANQATALKGIQAVVGAQVIFFSYEDEAWKQPGQFGVEQHWGCVNVF